LRRCAEAPTKRIRFSVELDLDGGSRLLSESIFQLQQYGSGGSQIEVVLLMGANSMMLILKSQDVVHPANEGPSTCVQRGSADIAWKNHLFFFRLSLL
jgi:hypothetical protein